MTQQIKTEPLVPVQVRVHETLVLEKTLTLYVSPSQAKTGDFHHELMRELDGQPMHDQTPFRNGWAHLETLDRAAVQFRKHTHAEIGTYKHEVILLAEKGEVRDGEWYSDASLKITDKHRYQVHYGVTAFAPKGYHGAESVPWYCSHGSAKGDKNFALLWLPYDVHSKTLSDVFHQVINGG